MYQLGQPIGMPFSAPSGVLSGVLPGMPPGMLPGVIPGAQTAIIPMEHVYGSLVINEDVGTKNMQFLLTRDKSEFDVNGTTKKAHMLCYFPAVDNQYNVCDNIAAGLYNSTLGLVHIQGNNQLLEGNEIKYTAKKYDTTTNKETPFEVKYKVEKIFNDVPNPPYNYNIYIINDINATLDYTNYCKMIDKLQNNIKNLEQYKNIIYLLDSNDIQTILNEIQVTNKEKYAKMPYIYLDENINLSNSCGVKLQDYIKEVFLDQALTALFKDPKFKTYIDSL